MSRNRMSPVCVLTGVAVGLSVIVSIASAQTLAFPGAEGFGRFATGGRGGTVYRVTNTNDSGPGSFREAVSVSGRTVVFDVGGVIEYKAPRYAPKPNITIAGQTAPGDGVTIYGNGLSFSGSHNNICRFIRVREGINGDSNTDAIGIANGHDMILDHISDSWGRDETFSVNGNVTNITIQSTIIAQGLQTHSAGGLIQSPGGVSILRCLYIDNDTRNPKVKFTNEFVNNLVLNWENIGYNMGGDSSGESHANVFNNYFIRGPNSGSSAISGGNTDFHIYATNNWYDGNRDGILDGSDLSYSSYGPMDPQAVPFSYPITNAMHPLTALKFVISDSGTSFKRDVVDERLLYEVQSWGTIGETISSEFAAPMNGPGLVRNGPAPLDTDLDGMPDYWEVAMGTSTNAPNNNDPSPSGSGYTRLEDYLNWLAAPHGAAQTNTIVAVDLRQFTRGFTNFGPAYFVSNPVNGSVSRFGSYNARFTPIPNYAGPASFKFTVMDTNGSTVTRTMNLFFTPMALARPVIWHGDESLNIWNVLGDPNWSDGVSLLFQFRNGDAVTFDDSGSTTPSINLIGSIQPASVSVSATKDYTFFGSGSLSGAMPLNKSGTGTLRLNNADAYTYTGATTISNGTLLLHGPLPNSAITVRSGGAIGGNGILGNGVTIQAGGALIPGDGIGAPGTLTISNSLAESGGVTNRFDLSDDPTGVSKTNDQIHIAGDLNVSGANVIKISLLDGLPGDGVYTLFTYTGNFNGTLANFTLAGVNGILTNPPNTIAVIVSSVRPPATLVWSGDGVNNIWDTGTNVTWLNDGAPDRFYFLDDVLFNDSGSTTPAANLKGDLTPNSVTVDTMAVYTFSGTGKITGTGGLTKTNSGTLTIQNVNDYTGVTTIGGGTLSVSQLANGNIASPVGASSRDPANLAFAGGALRYTGGNVTIDRGLTMNGSGALDITSSGTTLNHFGVITGTGPFIKAGLGTLNLNTNNTFTGGVTISNGTIFLANTHARDSGTGSGTITFRGGTLKMYNYGSTAEAGTFNRPLNVPANETGTVLTPGRYTMSSTLTGSGTLNLQVDYVRGKLSGNWNAFNGVVNATARSNPSEFRIANAGMFQNATVILNDNVLMDRNGGSSTIELGALGGTTGATVGKGNSSSSGTTYRIGWNNTDATFAGSFENDGTTTVIKVGTGTWTLPRGNSWSGGLTINGGRVLANNSSGSAVGSGAVVVNSGGAIGGSGFVGAAVTVNSGGAVSPGASVGTLTINSSLTLNSGSLLDFELGPTAASDRLAVSGTLTLGGMLNITNVAGFGPGTYTLFTYGSMNGSLPTIGSVPSGFNYSLDTDTPGQVRLVVETQTPPQFGSVTVANGNVTFSGGGGTSNATYYVLASTNLALPRNLWTRIVTNQFSDGGSFVVTNSTDPNQPQTFYLIQLP